MVKIPFVANIVEEDKEKIDGIIPDKMLELGDLLLARHVLFPCLLMEIGSLFYNQIRMKTH